MTTPVKTRGTIWRLCDKPNQGFGFIRDPATGLDYFFHNTELIDVTFKQLIVGDEVEFTAVDTPKGPRANEVTVWRKYQDGRR